MPDNTVPELPSNDLQLPWRIGIQVGIHAKRLAALERLGSRAVVPILSERRADAPIVMLADAGDQVALAAAVAAVGASRAQLVGLGVHDRVHDVLGDASHEPPQAHRPVL